MTDSNTPGDTGNLVNVVQVAALFSTIGFFISGSATCLKIHRQKSVKNVNFLPYLTTMLNCFLWFVYGTLKHDVLLCFVNLSGCLFQLAYIFVFIQNCDKKHEYLKKFFLVVAIGLCVATFTQYGSESFNNVDALGWISSSITVLMFGSPLSTMRVVVQTRNSETISHPLSIMTIFVSGSWFLYGHLIKDTFVQVPNIIGLILGVGQLFLYYKYLPMKSGILV